MFLRTTKTDLLVIDAGQSYLREKRELFGVLHRAMGEAAALSGGTRVKWVQHYNSSQKILLVGEGDFSFSASIARSFGSATNMVATSHDSRELLLTKHWGSVLHLKELKRLGCMVLHNVDAHQMNEHPILRTMKFDRVVFNFPHAGHDPLYGERDPDLIEQHKYLVSGFFQSASKMLKERGEVHVTHRDDYPYNRWKLKQLAKRAGLILRERVEFSKADYPGYHNKRGGGIRSNRTFPLRKSFTFKFVLESPLKAGEDETSANIYIDISDTLSALHF